eukprot:CAMPEP_0173088920 /NCGR_PEP_ID=MMETSP1102-20130122/25420_1 /TAXON_ID=49646 /ORGANISM="Geminigera sp., Strain Caron Lab Isolate" /LENGTH=573 /DNA_ID=CAMNT_0013972313 /DNA_START=35 /DNA_END=1755 /DNA_ORIENTATION=+
MKRCDVRGVAKAALLLGGKIEEQPRKLHDILNVFHAGALRRHSRKVEPLVSGTKRYFELKEDILNAEQAILRELGFIIHAEHAHKFVFYYIRVLLAKGFNEQYPELAQKAWNYANDLYRSTLCLKYRPNVLACASIFLASRDLKIPLPEPSWWELFDVEQPQVFEVATGILSLYKLPKAKHVNLRDEPDKEDVAAAKPSDKALLVKVEGVDASATATIEVAEEKKEEGVGGKIEDKEADSKDAEKALEASLFKSATPDVVAAADKDSRSESGSMAGGEKKDERRTPPPSDRDRNRDDDRRRDDGRSRDVRDRDRDRDRRDRDRDRSRSRDRGGSDRRVANRDRSPGARRASGRNRSASPIGVVAARPDGGTRGSYLAEATGTKGVMRATKTKTATAIEMSETEIGVQVGNGAAAWAEGAETQIQDRQTRQQKQKQKPQQEQEQEQEQEKSMSKSRSKSRSPSADLADLVKSRKSSSSKSDSKSKEPDAKSADSKGNGIKKGDDDRDRKSSGKPKIKPAIVFPGEDSTTKPRAPIKPACANDDELEDKSTQKSLSDQDEEKRRKRAEKYGTGGG